MVDGEKGQIQPFEFWLMEGKIASYTRRFFSADYVSLMENSMLDFPLSSFATATATVVGRSFKPKWLWEKMTKSMRLVFIFLSYYFVVIFSPPQLLSSNSTMVFPSTIFYDTRKIFRFEVIFGLTPLPVAAAAAYRFVIWLTCGATYRSVGNSRPFSWCGLRSAQQLRK